jgi:hypothetical protein
LPVELVLPAHGEPTDRAALERGLFWAEQSIPAAQATRVGQYLGMSPDGWGER